MNFPSWRSLKSLERGRGERVDLGRASGLSVVSECLNLSVFFSWPFKVRAGQP